MEHGWKSTPIYGSLARRPQRRASRSCLCPRLLLRRGNHRISLSPREAYALIREGPSIRSPTGGADGKGEEPAEAAADAAAAAARVAAPPPQRVPRPRPPDPRSASPALGRLPFPPSIPLLFLPRAPRERAIQIGTNGKVVSQIRGWVLLGARPRFGSEIRSYANSHALHAIVVVVRQDPLILTRRVAVVFAIVLRDMVLGIICALLVVCVVYADVQKEEKNVEKAIREAAKRNDMGSAKV